jgi:hypothetical protein
MQRFCPNIQYHQVDFMLIKGSALVCDGLS